MKFPVKKFGVYPVRIILACIVLIFELYFLLGTGVLGEERICFLTGEGSWDELQSQENNVFCQKFVPRHKQLRSLSFLMNMTDVTVLDGSVKVSVIDEDKEVLFDKTLLFSEISDGSFTNVKTELNLSVFESYYLTLETSPSSLGEYPSIGVCGKKYRMRENRGIVLPDGQNDAQLVDRFVYDGALTWTRIAAALILSFITAAGVGIGLPEDAKLRKRAAVALLILAPLFLGYRLEHVNFNKGIYLPIAIVWNLGLMYVFELVVWLCTHSKRIALIFSNVVLTLIYSVNYFVTIYRGTPLRINDFSAAGTAVTVLGNYSFVPNSELAFSWAMLLLFIIFDVQTGIKDKDSGNKTENLDIWDRLFGKWRLGRLFSYVASISAAVIIVLAGGYSFIYTDLLKNAGFANEELMGMVGHDAFYYYDGYLVATCLDINNSKVRMPEGYSVNMVREILEEYAGNDLPPAREDLPHIILIMNESFADLSVVKDLSINQENLTFTNSLSENTVRGYVNASVLGGGTANSEFEVFTGSTVAFFPANYYPYQQIIKKPINSMISRLKQYGYTTYSMHPAASSNWNREKVYDYYGFDESLWKQDFEGAKVIHYGVSDEETYKKVIELYEGRQDNEKLFIFDLTIQNHGGYHGNEAPYEVRETELNNPQVDEYLSLVKISDEAFEDLVGYFEKQDEKVVICMFGDHQPWVSDLLMDEDASMEKQMDKYKTPFIIWTNYDIDEEDGYDISMNYLGGVLMETAEIPLTPYFSFLKAQREEYPIITLNGYVDKDGNYSTWGDKTECFEDYRMLQYNHLSGNDTVEWGY